MFFLITVFSGLFSVKLDSLTKLQKNEAVSAFLAESSSWTARHSEVFVVLVVQQILDAFNNLLHNKAFSVELSCVIGFLDLDN